jgi:DNA polymerase delta subunit 1
MDFFPVDWRATEHETSFEITCYGKLGDGRSVCVHVPFYPYFFVECPANWQASRAKIFVSEMIVKCAAVPKYSLPVARKSLWGFSNNQTRIFAQLAFFTLAAFRRARRAIPERYKMKTYEASVDQVLRLFHVRDLKPAQWVRASAWKQVLEANRTAVTDLEVTVDFTALAAAPLDAIPPVVLASWDIECYSASGAFPLADKPGDVICTICTSFQRFGEPRPYLQHAVTLGGCDPLPGVEVVACATEAEVVNAWLDVLRREQVDVLCGWNTFQFDSKYLYGRSLVCVDDLTGEPLIHLEQLGKAREGGGVPVQKALSSAAYGDNAFFYLASPGVINLDLMQSIKREHKFESYSLNAVAGKILGDQKIDLKPSEIFAKAVGTDADRAVVAEYCAKDTLLPLQLMDKLSVMQNMMEMANATTVPLTYLLERGQQIKVYSLIVRKARSLGYVCPDIERGAPGAEADKYEGATVLDAQKGAYLEDVVSALDFASLYPSIIRAHNLCPSTLVMDPAFEALPGVEYETIATPLGRFTFAQGVPSVVPALLSDLALFRKEAKRQMALAKAAGDHFRASVENSKQLAYKVSMNR